jgi:primosomal protein N' (replication factor Y) (superfamily II helicase)
MTEVQTAWLDVVVPLPAHSAMGPTLTYRHTEPLRPGSLVRVPVGKRDVLGLVWTCRSDAPPDLAQNQTRDVIHAVTELPPLTDRWCQLVEFAARYYQRHLGEVALSALPPQLRDATPEQLARKFKRLQTSKPTNNPDLEPQAAPPLTPEQSDALRALASAHQPVLLYGTTGSGKTEVYLRAVERVLETDPNAQALVLVPEINLTPQLEARFNARLGRFGVVAMHSGLTPAQRFAHWVKAHLGQARIVLGTRMAVFASVPHLRLIVVDEEHDPSYKSQDGARYSARDLAVYRAQLESSSNATPCRVMLGSATPSLESWRATELGRYLRVPMVERMGGGALPRLRLVDMNHQPKHGVLAPPLLDAMGQRIARGEQCMLLLNRRGYAPVLACHACGWKSDCPHCSAHAVFHKLDRTLRCHHCGHASRVPRACPDCGNLDISPVGRGTEQIEEHLAALLTDIKRPDGSAVRIARVDADSTRQKGSLERHLNDVHSGEVDVLVGTQMIAKGHDFRRITLVACLNTDSGLFSSDYRAPERLFALLMQAAGRAGRDAVFVAQQGAAVELWVQTWYPQHPLFAALGAHNFAAFAQQQLEEREIALMPPYSHQALLRAEARTQEAAMAFLQLAEAHSRDLPGTSHVTRYPPVPATVQRVANVERTQMLLESPSRPALQAFLQAWQTTLHWAKAQPQAKGLVRWAIDVDPVSI